MNYNEILQIIKTEYERILSDNLVGIYVHGSIAFECFNEEKSDIDFIVVINSEIDSNAKIKLLNSLESLRSQSPSKGLEMSVVLKENCINFKYPTPYELHFSNYWLNTYLNNSEVMCSDETKVDYDLSAHFTIIRKFGIVLCGQPIKDVFGKVKEEYYIDSIMRDIGDSRDEILDNTTYVVLNLCRVLAYLKEKLILSKEEGGKWALRNIDNKYHKSVKIALEDYKSSKSVKVSDKEKVYFSEYMLVCINNRRWGRDNWLESIK
ncbi:aminoglycoside adenylyltransferase domain-containing protein [Clostridium sp.]|uniref:aminoglycoside adenylyltransferase domain-containing protein n=1 Tax=Clostridium sp. TaxID=1506 RepID=UPI003216CC0E